MAEPTLRVCALYPELMNIYADRGNLLLLERRCQWRGLGFELLASDLDEALERIRAPLLEEKVVDYILTKAKVTDKKIDAEELLKKSEELND